MLNQDWLTVFIENSGCENNQPDGRPLFAYRCKQSKYRELQLLLSSPHTVNTPGVGALFVLYCAEWWKRNYSGGPWKWEPITRSIGLELQWSEVIKLVGKGLRYWKRDLIKTGSGTQYLLSVACEGGIPINVLEKENASFRHFLKSILREYGYYAESGVSVESISKDNLYRLPTSWRQEQIATLSGQIIEKIWEFTQKIGNAQVSVESLNRAQPGWSKSFPIELHSEQAEKLINSLLSEASAISTSIASSNVKSLKVERYLNLNKSGHSITAKLYLPRELCSQQILETMQSNSNHSIPERMEMYRVINGERELIARLSGDADVRYIRPVPGATKDFCNGSTKEISVVLSAKGSDIASLGVAGGEALDESMPWSFVRLDDETSFKWVGQGSCQHSDSELYVLYDTSPQSCLECNSDIYDKIEINDNKDFWIIPNKSSFEPSDSTDTYYIEPGLQGIAERDYRLCGNRKYFPETKFPLYQCIPDFHSLGKSGISKNIPTEELYWRPIKTRDWKPYNKSQMIGDIEVRHRINGSFNASWKLSILPKDFNLQVSSTSHLRGELEMKSCGISSIQIPQNNNLVTDIHRDHGSWRITCKRNTISNVYIKGHISWDNNRNIDFSLPFPAEGASFINGLGNDTFEADVLSLSRLHGYRAQIISSTGYKKYNLKGRLITKNQFDLQSDFYSFDYPVITNEFGVGILPLQQLYEDIENLFAISTNVDDRVQLDILDNNNIKSSIKVQQFEGDLCFYEDRRIIHLDLNINDTFSEYGNCKLSLACLNNPDLDPVILDWNEMSQGWNLDSSLETEYRSSYTYIAAVSTENPHKIRPCIIPPSEIVEFGSPSRLSVALTTADSKQRNQLISRYLIDLTENGSDKEWTELRGYLKSFVNIHPDGLDLVTCMLDHPKIMSTIWFHSSHDNKLNSYLESICKTGPFSWWMIGLQDWCESLDLWLNSIDVNPTFVKETLIEKCKKELNNLLHEHEEMNTIVDILLEKIGDTLNNQSIIYHVRAFPNATWVQIDNLCKRQFINSIDEMCIWPKFIEISQLRKSLDSSIFNAIDWPIKEMGYQKSVIYTPIVIAAALHQGLEINEQIRVAALVARNFHPNAFATIFRASQAFFWVNKERAFNE